MGTKRVGVLTFHMAHNYGAMLQAYATPIAIQSLGYDCEVINYRFAYIDNWSRIEYLDELVRRYGKIGGFLRYIKRAAKGGYNPNTARSKFSYFERNVIPHSEEIMETDGLNNLPYDCIIFGSDQIWNSNLTDGIASAYVGDFRVFDNTRKVAYAASCGNSDFNMDCKRKYLDCIRDFYSVGVRESGLATTLVNNGIEVELVLDPTLLLTKDKWLDMVNKVPGKIEIPNNYLLVYVFDEDEKIYDFSKKIAKEYGLNIVVIAYEQKEILRDFQVYTNCGPGDFVNLIANAEFVITTSFHGTVFSLLMQKEFYCIPHPKYHERTDSLLKLVNLENRNIYNLEQLPNKEQIDWQMVNATITMHREKSYEFLKKSIQ